MTAGAGSTPGAPGGGRFLHRVCGLVLDSPLPLPLPAASPPADVRLVRAPVPEAPEGANPPPVLAPGGEVVLAWGGLGAFRVGRRRVVFDAAPGAPPEAVAAQLLGPVLAVLLHLRGVLPLHASAVATPAGAAAFLGFSGAGKSTVAAALVRRGARLLADDVTAVAVAPDAPPRVLAAVPALRLAPDSAAALGWAGQGGPGRGAAEPEAADPESVAPKAVFGVPPGPDAVPLAGVWVLDAGSETRIEDLPPRSAAAELLRHGWTSRLVGLDGVAAAEAAAHLERCAAVAAAVPVRRLVLGPLAALPEVEDRLASRLGLAAAARPPRRD